MERHGLMEIELVEEGRKIRLRKAPPQPRQQNVITQVQPHTEIVGPGDQAAREEMNPALQGLEEIQSPIVGSFYRAPSPEADNFVEEGDHVNEGDVVCIVEAMKVMNEIKAECSGVIRKIIPENTQAVEFGDVLFLLEPD